MSSGRFVTARRSGCRSGGVVATLTPATDARSRGDVFVLGQADSAAVDAPRPVSRASVLVSRAGGRVASDEAEVVVALERIEQRLESLERKVRSDR
jgi:hypothetical protein